jgi:hypothetical protein
MRTTKILAAGLETPGLARKSNEVIKAIFTGPLEFKEAGTK